MEEVLFESEKRYSREEIADLIADAAESLREGRLTLEAGDGSIELDVPRRPVLEVKVERETEGDQEEMSVEFEVEWDVGGGDADADIEVG
ncbi:MAG: amphi-Trp domain-containing protein [Halobacteriota archaeon]